MALFCLAQVLLFLVAVPSFISSENGQSWSHQAYKDDPYTLACESDSYTPFEGDTLTWYRDGMDEPVTNNDHFELRSRDAVLNVELHVKKVTDETSGIYLCHIRNTTEDKLMDSVVLGLNVGRHKYHDKLDKYRENIIIGAIAGAGVFVFILTVGLISHFRYLSEESLEKRRQRKEDRLARKQNKHGLSNDTYENGGADFDGNKVSATAM